MSQALRWKISCLLIFPIGTIDKLKNKITITDFQKCDVVKDRSLAVHYLSMLEHHGLVQSEMAIIREPTKERPKGLASRVFWATEECLELSKKVTDLLLICENPTKETTT